MNDKLAIFLKALDLLGPPALALLAPAAAPFIPLIVNGIGEAKQIPGATNEAKKAHVMSIAATGIATENAVAGRQVLDPVLTLSAVSNAVDTTIDLVNVAKGTHVAVAVPF